MVGLIWMVTDVCWAGTLYLEAWKRSQAVIDYKWNVLNFETEEVGQLLCNYFF